MIRVFTLAFGLEMNAWLLPLGLATLIAGGMPIERALQAAVVEPLTDEPEVAQALRDVIASVYG